MRQEAEEYYDSIDLHVRWTEGQDLVLRVSPADTIQSIKEKVFFAFIARRKFPPPTNLPARFVTMLLKPNGKTFDLSTMDEYWMTIRVH